MSDVSSPVFDLSLGGQRALLREDRVGTLCHRALAWLLAHDLPLDEPHAVAATNAVLPQVAPVYQLSMRAWISSSIARYRHRFERESRWRFVGAELIVGDVALDLLWIDASGRIEADELKTGPQPAGSINRSIAQATAQARIGSAALGRRFDAVRLVVLNDPALSVWVRPDGSSRPVFETSGP